MSLYIGYERIPDGKETYCGRALLEPIIEYVKENLEPGQVYDLDQLAEYVDKAFGPDEVFAESTLETWAKENGWIQDDGN